MELHVLTLLKTPDFVNFISRLGYFGIYIWFISFDQLTPLPEEFSLLLIGYLVANHIFNPFLAGIASLAGFLTIDIIYYFLSKSGSKLLRRNNKEFTSSLLKSYKEKLTTNLPKTLLILCFIPRIRLWAPIMIGAMKVPFGKFMFYNTIGLAAFTALYLSLGVFFHQGLSVLFQKMKLIQNIVFFGSIAIIAIITLLIIRKRNKKKTTSS